MTTCTRNGCGKTYDDATNTSMSCQYHTGLPKFHEGKRGWTCCPPRVFSFDEFLEIPGCTLGPHSSDKKHKSDPFKADLTKYDDVLPANDQPAAALVATAVAAAKPEVAKQDLVIEEDPEGVVVAEGAACKRNGCAVKHNGESGDPPCVFHPGHAVFHEGRQGWSCCKRRETSFDEFLAIPGCTTGKHLFVGAGTASGALAGGKKDKCRMDFFQNGSKIVVSVYARKLDREKSSVEISKKSLKLHVEYMDGKVYDDVVELFAEVDPETSVSELLSTKIEISLAKLSQAEWPQLTME